MQGCLRSKPTLVMLFFNGIVEDLSCIISNAAVEFIKFTADYTRVAERAEFDTEFSVIVLTNMFIELFRYSI